MMKSTCKRTTKKLMKKFWKWIKSSNGKIIFTIITALASIATIMAVFLTRATLIEIQKQRITANQPELVIDTEVPFGLYFRLEFDADTFRGIIIYSYNTKIDSNHFYLKSVDDWYIKRYNLGNDFKFNLINVGLGVAKNINLTWSFDTVLIQQYYNDTFKIFVGIDKILKRGHKIGFVSFNNIVEIHNWDKNLPIKYILPSVGDNNIKEIKMPEVYTQLWAFIELCKLHYDSEVSSIHWSDDIFPPLLLNMTYEDINGVTYCKTYKIKINKGFTYAGGRVLVAAEGSKVSFSESL